VPIELPFPDPPLEDELVRLRAWRPGDAKAAAAWGSDPEILRWTSVPEGRDERGVRMFHLSTEALRRSGEAIHFAIVDAHDTVLGSCDIRVNRYDPKIVELGYLLDAAGRGHGLATASVRLMASWAAETLGVARIQVLCHPDNERSHRVAERAGFTREGVLRAWREHNGVREDRVVFALIP